MLIRPKSSLKAQKGTPIVRAWKAGDWKAESIFWGSIIDTGLIDTDLIDTSLFILLDM